MKNSSFIFICFLIAISIFSCNSKQENIPDQIGEYIPADKELYDAIMYMDKKFFEAYNHCNLEEQADIYSDNIEFYHDKGGLITSKQEILDATEKNICGKITRELIDGSIEVYPITNYGAVQIGYHKFYNNEEPDAQSNPSKFIVVWFNDSGNWKMTKVISLH